MRTALFSVALVSLMAGCANNPCAITAKDGPKQHVTLRSPGGFDQLALEGGRIFGPNTDVMHFEDGYRGRAYDRFVDLRVQDNRIEGSIGSAHTELHVRPLDGGFTVRGLWGGRLGELVVLPDRFESNIGGRIYHLRASATEEGVYESVRGAMDAPGVTRTTGSVAGIMPGPVEIVLPTGFAALPAEHQATVLALFLGR